MVQCELIRWPSGLGWWTGILNEAPNQEVVGSVPAAGSSKKVFHPGRKLQRFFLPNLFTSPVLTIPPTRPHQVCWLYLPSINRVPIPFYLLPWHFFVQVQVLSHVLP